MTRLLRKILLVMVMLMTSAQAQQPIRYTVSFPAPQTHYIEVQAVFPSQGRSELELVLPVWTPGSYMVREYSRHFEEVNAPGHSIQKTRKNSWRVSSDGQSEVEVNYRVYCREMTVRTNWVDADFASLTPAATFMTDSQNLQSPHQVTLKLPSDWQGAYCGLPSPSPNVFAAENFDQLVDSPILAGNPAVHRFEVEGRHHLLLNVGEGTLWDGAQAAKDAQKIIETQIELWGSVPYDKYLIMNLITEARGGLEHRNSTVLMTGRFKQRVRKDYLGWLSLVSHEYFHTWNVKRLRPVALGPFDYENENYTRSLWVAEGITSYYDDLMVRRAGLMKDDEYLEGLSKSIERVQTSPGRLVHSLSESSFDAWIKLYRPDENSVNTTISYYTKGLLVSWLLDVELRRLSDGKKTLDDLLRAAYDRFATDGFEEQQFRALAEEIAGADLDGFFAAYVDGVEELDFTPALDYLGLRFKTVELDEEQQKVGWTGLKVSDHGGRLLVDEVVRDTPGAAAGLNVEDEILALDRYRVTHTDWNSRFQQHPPGVPVEVLIARRGELRTLTLVPVSDPGKRFQLEVHPEASEQQRQRLRAWLDGPRS